MIKQCLSAMVLVLALTPAASRSGRPSQAAAAITVSTFDDELNADGDCSLREAVQSANLNTAVDACAAGSGDDVITLAAGTYVLALAGADDANASGDLDIAPTISAERLTIQGAGAAASRIDGNDLDRVIHVVTLLGGLRLVDLTVQNGHVTDAGGGGVLNWGDLQLENVVISGNTISGTSSDAIGGGLCNGCVTGSGQATLIATTIKNNAAQRGGGIFSNRPLTITASSVITNTALAGGGITNYGALIMLNSTLSGNAASSNAGAIAHSAGSMSIRNSTISHNTSPSVGGIVGSAGNGELSNTIVADNTNNNCAGNLTSQGHNLSDDASCAAFFSAPGDQNSTAARLGPLTGNGGPTLTRALLPGSPAINAGSNTGCPAADQRGIARPNGATCDIGAYEREGIDAYLYLPALFK